MKAVVWVERTSCNYRCPYCIVCQKDIPQAPVTWQQWVERLNALNPGVIDITGGEPFMNDNLVDIIAGLNSNICVGLTTNLSKDITQFVQRLPASRLVNMTLSYHPSQHVTLEQFTGKALLLKNRGFPICVNVVAYPEQMFLIAQLKGHFDALGIRLHVDPYSINPPKPYTFNEDEKRYVSSFCGDDRAYRFKAVESNVVHCSAGRDYAVIQPDGKVFRCMSMVWKDQAYMGNLFDPDFKLPVEDLPCDQYFGSCAGCDMDKVTVTP